MDIVEAWLSATIQRDLSEAIDELSTESPGLSGHPYEDDGSNLRVTASKPGVVQIIKVRLFYSFALIAMAASEIIYH